MPDISQHLLAISASRLADQIWSIRDTSLQAYLGAHAAGEVQRIAAPSQGLPSEAQSSVAIFRVEGVLVPKAEWYGEVGSFALAAALQAAAHNDAIEAGILWIDSPGGVCHGMLEAVRAAAEFAEEKSLIAHVSGCCCSAAYHLASQAKQIFAGPRDDIGSIGTRSLLYDYSKYFAELGVEAVTSDTGPIKSLGVPGTSVSAEQREFLKSRVDYLQEDFRSNVMRGRGMTAEQFDTIATGAWWFGEQAVSLGLIDGVQTYQETFAGLESAISVTTEPIGSHPMADKKTTNEPQAATTAELKKMFPNSDAAWREDQTEAGTTLTEASVSYAQAKEKELEASQAAQKEAEEKADAAEKKAAESSSKEKETTQKKKGNQPVAKGGDDVDEDTTGDIDYRAMAKQLAKDKEISYREACRRIQKQHGLEARNAFKMGQLPPK